MVPGIYWWLRDGWSTASASTVVAGGLPLRFLAGEMDSYQVPHNWRMQFYRFPDACATGFNSDIRFPAALATGPYRGLRVSSTGRLYEGTTTKIAR